MKSLRERIEELKERLLDPFNVDGLEKEFGDLLEAMKRADPEEVLSVKEDLERVKELLYRNVEIISGGLKPLVSREQGGLFSRRV